MDSLDAQCLLIQLADGEIRPPDFWRHDRSGALSCAYEGGEQVFTWRAEDVAELARTWRDSARSQMPEQLQLVLEAHQRLAALADEAGMDSAPVMLHDLRRAELRGIWRDVEIMVTVDDGEALDLERDPLGRTPDAPRGPIASA
jgi:hypothetical protein